MDASPDFIICAAITIDFNPEAQTLLMVVQGTVLGIPANMAACRAGACPSLACKTFPIKTSSTKSGFKFIFSNAAFIATAPSLGALTLDNPPKKLPTGVRAIDTITTCVILFWFLNIVLANLMKIGTKS